MITNDKQVEWFTWYELSFDIKDYTTSTSEIIVKPVLPPIPACLDRILMTATGNSASIKSFLKLKKAYAGGSA